MNKDIGDLLKQRREELGYSLKDAAERTRIRKSYLESMEENRFSALPGRAYVTGFIRVYAGYLGMDSAPLLKQLDELSPAEDVAPQPVIVSAPARSKPKKSGKTSSWVGFFIGFAVVLMLGGAIYLFMPSADEIIEPQPVEQSTAVTKTQEKVQEQIQEEAQETEPPTAVPVTAQEDKAPVEPAAVAEEAMAVNSVEKVYPAIKKNGSSLRMLAMSESSLIIYVDKRTPHEYQLHEGLDLTWNVKEHVKIEMKAPGAARFWLDGEEVKLGENVSFELSQNP